MNYKSQRGAISLFIVIFTTLLVTIVAVSFTQLMVRNQQQVLSSDLSQRAYDSAMAGVEDGKRLLIYQEKVCSGGTDSDECVRVTKLINDKECSTIQDSPLATNGGTGGNDEVTVGQKRDNQAYTCVVVNPDTESYQDSLQSNTPTVLPLRTTKSFNRIKISWFTKQDSEATPTPPSTLTTDELPKAADWSATTPPLMRMQYIPGSVDISDLDDKAGTLMLYPQDVGANDGFTFDSGSKRRSGSFSASPVQCGTSFDVKPQGVCTATVSVGNTKSAYLQLAPIYNKAHFTVQLYNSDDPAEPVKFHNVQPTIDSTGRADNVFRRVLAHVSVKNGVTMPYPEATINVNDNLCKTFFITDDKGGYDSGVCDPDEELNKN